MIIESDSEGSSLFRRIEDTFYIEISLSVHTTDKGVGPDRIGRANLVIVLFIV